MPKVEFTPETIKPRESRKPLTEQMKLKLLKHSLDFVNNPLAKHEGVREKAKVRKEL